MKATDVFRVVHAGHDVREVTVVAGDLLDPPLICFTCWVEEHGGESVAGEQGA
jgi:hypothetical protein